jgi:acetyl esterase/lipase
MTEFHPQLRFAATIAPRFTFRPWIVRVMQGVQRWRGVARAPRVDGLAITDRVAQGPNDNPSIRVRFYEPDVSGESRPILVWFHGGGYMFGHPEQDADLLATLAKDLKITIAAVQYRFSPEHPFPAAIEDAYAALVWIYMSTATLGIDPGRIAVGGASAGGGLAAGLALLARDRGEVPLVFQLLVYPMLDDRTTLRTGQDERTLRLWNGQSNLLGWTSYLGGQQPGGDATSPYAAPSRSPNLAGLPAAWIGIGTCDLFYEEDLAYAAALRQAGVPCALEIVDGAFHGFDLFAAKTPIVRQFKDSFRKELIAQFKL